VAVQFLSPESSEADEFYLALERDVTHHAGENNSLAHGESMLLGESFARSLSEIRFLKFAFLLCAVL
jgi:hypothetical protein